MADYYSRLAITATSNAVIRPHQTRESKKKEATWRFLRISAHPEVVRAADRAPLLQTRVDMRGLASVQM